MTTHEQLVAYLATLIALVVVFAIAIIAAALVPELLGKAEVFGLGTITGGLIGILRIPASRNVTVDNPPDKPVQTEEAKP
jgi:uncharacterized membrane protein YjjP (DUF1212 family)